MGDGDTLIQTAKLNGVDPLAWLTDVLERIVSGRTKAHESTRCYRGPGPLPTLVPKPNSSRRNRLSRSTQIEPVAAAPLTSLRPIAWNQARVHSALAGRAAACA